MTLKAMWKRLLGATHIASRHWGSVIHRSGRRLSTLARRVVGRSRFLKRGVLSDLETAIRGRVAQAAASNPAKWYYLKDTPRNMLMNIGYASAMLGVLNTDIVWVSEWDLCLISWLFGGYSFQFFWGAFAFLVFSNTSLCTPAGLLIGIYAHLPHIILITDRTC